MRLDQHPLCRRYRQERDPAQHRPPIQMSFRQEKPVLTAWPKRADMLPFTTQLLEKYEGGETMGISVGSYLGCFTGSFFCNKRLPHIFRQRGIPLLAAAESPEVYLP